jgi:glycosyltransferase involved in cell wall biosynthesis
LRVAFLSPSGELGGAETSLLDVLASLRDAQPSWPLHLVAAADGPLLPRAATLGVTTAVVPFPRAIARLGEHGAAHGAAPGGGFARLATQIGMAARPIAAYTSRLRRAIAACAPDVVESNGLKMHLLGARACDAPLVWHVHDYLGSRRLTARLLRWSSSRCAAIVANSQSVAADVRQMLGPGAPVVTVYNAIDLQRFSPIGDAIDLDRAAGLARAPAGTVRVGLVATYARWKGHATFLQAIARLPASAPPVRAYVIGGPIYQTDGSQYSIDELRDLARAADLEDRVGFTGFLVEPEHAMRALDVVVHASTDPEPFGLVIAQAMACGRAVVASDAGGAAELFTRGVDAIGHAPGNVEALAAAIQPLVADRDLRERLGVAARATAERLFDRARLARELTPIYERAVAAAAA